MNYLSGTSQNCLEDLADNCSVGDYIKECKKQDDEVIYTREFWEECDNQEFSEELTENVCIIILTMKLVVTFLVLV